MSLSSFVVLLHGLGATPYTLIGLEKYLNWQGYSKSYKISYPSDKLNLQNSLDHVDLELQKLINKDTDKIIIIGQSMGGVIGGLMHTKGWDVEKLITIGSPLKGASLVKQLEDTLPMSIQNALYKPMYQDLVDMLDKPLETPPHDYHCITMAWPWPFSQFDGCVYIDEGRFCDQKHTHLYWADHRLVFANPRLWWHVHQNLTN